MTENIEDNISKIKTDNSVELARLYEHLNQIQSEEMARRKKELVETRLGVVNNITSQVVDAIYEHISNKIRNEKEATKRSSYAECLTTIFQF